MIACLQSSALALLCPQKSWSSTSTTKPVGLAVGVAEPVLPSAPCVHKCTQLYIVHFTRFRASAHTIAPPMPRAPPPRHNVVPRQQSSPAQQHRIQLPILAQVLAPAFIHTYYVLQIMPPTLSAPRSCPLCATAGTKVTVSEISSCTPAHRHAHASPHVRNISCISTILSQQQLRDQPLPTKYDSQ